MNRNQQNMGPTKSKSLSMVKLTFTKNSITMLMSPYHIKKIHINKHQSLFKLEDQISTRINQQNYQRSMKKLQKRYQTIDRWKLKYNSNGQKYLVHRQQDIDHKQSQKLPSLRLNKNIPLNDALLQSPNKFWTELEVKKAKVGPKETMKYKQNKKYTLQKQSKCHFMVQPFDFGENRGIFPQIASIVPNKFKEQRKSQRLKSKSQDIQNASSGTQNQILQKIVQGNPERWDMNIEDANEMDNEENSISPMRVYENFQ